MGVILNKTDGSLGEAGVEDVCDGEQRGSNDSAHFIMHCKVFWQEAVQPQNHCTAHPLHSSTVDGQWGMLWLSPEVSNNLFGLPHIEEEIVIFAPLDQVAHFAPVAYLIVVCDEAHHSCVNPESGCAVCCSLTAW